VTIDGGWVINWIYWTLTDPWLQVIITISLILALTVRYSTHLSLLSLLCVHRLFGNGFQWRTFLYFWVPELSPCLSCQLLTAETHNDRLAAVLLTNWLLTNQLTSIYCAQLHCTQSVESGSLGADHIGNATSNSISHILFPSILSPEELSKEAFLNVLLFPFDFWIVLGTSILEHLLDRWHSCSSSFSYVGFAVNKPNCSFLDIRLHIYSLVHLKMLKLEKCLLWALKHILNTN
jgi:hypothetical protein